MPVSVAFKHLPVIKKGEVITGAFLSDITRTVNQLTQLAIENDSDKIKDLDITFPDGGEAEILTNDDSGLTFQPNQVWVEKSRTTDTVRVEDPDDAETYVDVARIRIVTSSNLFGEEKVEIFQAE